MDSTKKKYSEQYLTYFGLDLNARIRFYLDKIATNQLLDFHEKLELDIDYAQALFEIGKYEKFLYVIDHLIELVIEENIYTLNGQDIYETLLVKKAQSHLFMDECSQAYYVAEQIIKINPHNQKAIQVLQSIQEQNNVSRTFWLLQPIAVLTGIFAVTFTVLDIFVIDTFFNQYHIMMTWITRITLCISVFSFAVVYWHNVTDFIRYKMK